jgi:hypothetical protein
MRRLLLMTLLLILAACAQSSTPAQTIEKYLQARVESDSTTLQQLACSAWEAQAALEAESFRSANGQLDGMVCRETGQADGYTVVECDGRLLTTYDGETRERELGAYRLIQEGGEWKMCGEAAPLSEAPAPDATATEVEVVPAAGTATEEIGPQG